MSTEAWMLDAPQTLDIDGARELRAGIIRGRLDIITHDEPTTRVEISQVDGEPLAATLQNGILDIRHGDARTIGMGWMKRLAAAADQDYAVISIAVPEGIAVSASTVSGDGLVCGTSSTTTLRNNHAPDHFRLLHG